MALPSIIIEFENVTTEDCVQVPEMSASLIDGDHLASVELPNEPEEWVADNITWGDVIEQEALRTEYVENILGDYHYGMECLIRAAFDLIKHGGDLRDATNAVRSLKI